MATTQNTYTGNGSTTDYSITFEYLKDADVKVTLDHVATTAFTLPNATTLRFNTAPGNNVAIRIFRDTDVDAARFVYSAGSAIKAAELNENADQALYGLQETVNTDDITDAAVTTAKIRDGAVTTAKLANVSITTAQLADSSVTTAKIAADAVNGTKIADDSINSEHYVDGSIDTAHIADAQITTAKIADDAVTTAKILDDNVTAAKLATDSVTADAIAAGAVATSELATDAVTTVKIVDDAVTTAKIASGAVTSDSIANGTIQTEDIADVNITTAKIANDAVTAAKLADNAVVTDNIVDANVTTAKIADSAVTTAKIADAELVELATMGGNTASALADLTQSEVQILDGATVTTAELNILDGVTATATELNQLDGKTLKTTSTDFTSSSQFPAASEIDARITARIDPLGGFEAIADEDSFPATAPPAGTVVSIANSNGLAVNGSGVGAGTRAGGSDAVIINGFPSEFNSTSLDNGIGLLVIATSTAHTYDFHRVVAKNEDVRQLSSDINDFKARYRIGSSNPTTDNDAGDLFFNTGTSKMLVYNATSSAWEEVQAVGDFFINTLSSSSGTGGGSATFNGTAFRFTLSNAPTYAQQLLVSINGVVQKPNSGTSQPSEGFAIDGSDIILAAAPASGANAFFITIGSSVGIGTPSDNTISTAKIIDGAVTTAKIAADAVTGAKIADDAVGAEHIEVLDANLQFADSAKAQFGTGNDLEIYHDGSESYIADEGDGGITISSGLLSFKNQARDETHATMSVNGSVDLYYDNNKKFETKSDGIDVTGEVQCDSLDVDGNADISGNSVKFGNYTFNSNTTSGVEVDTGSLTTQRASSSGASARAHAHRFGADIKYELKNDGSAYFAGDVGIGTSSPQRDLHIHNADSSTNTYLQLTSATTGTGSTDGFQLWAYGSGSSSNAAIVQRENAALEFWTNNSEQMRIDSSGRVGIGVSDPKKDLHVDNTVLLTGTAPQIRLNSNANDASDDDRAMFGLATASGHFFSGSAAGDTVIRTTNNGNILFGEGTTERLRLLSAGGLTFNGDTAAANALDDYEEGTFTATCANSVTLHSSTDTCQYIKVGNLVTVFGQIRVNSSNSSSDLVINNLPFAAHNVTESSGFSTGAVRLYDAAMSSLDKYVVALVDAGSNNLIFQSVRDNAASVPFSATDDAFYMFNVSYKAT